MKKIVYSLIILLSVVVFYKESLSWNENITHRDLSEYAAKYSILGKTQGDRLKDIGFQDGLDENIRWNKDQSVIEWLQEGAKSEDKSDWGFPVIPGTTTRSFNHFHNPLKDWPQAGLNDLWTGESALLWAQDRIDQQNIVEGDQTWQQTRDYFYLALTLAADSLKQENFAKTFKGLGHQMHLLQDMAVPDHVRNDAHPEDALLGKNILNGSKYFETWAKEILPNIKALTIFAPAPFFPDISLDISYNGLAPITQLSDAEQYNGTNPSDSFSQGLAEYTNANFFSGDTIFAGERYSIDHRHYSPYPKATSTDLQSFLLGTKPAQTVTARDGNSDTGIWITKTSDGEEIQYFVRTSKFTKLLYNVFGQGELFYKSFYRDEKCHEDYAQKLIPRAVGYSAGLLDYFFRGVLEISAPDQYVYAITDGSKIFPYEYTDEKGNTYHTQQQLFTHIKAKVLNMTPKEKDPEGNILSYEDIVSGSLLAVARYKVIPDYSPDLANYPPDGTVMMNNILYKFSVSLPVTLTPEEIILLNTQPTEFTFDFTGNEIPAGITDLTLQVIFKGTLGNETDIAVAVGMKNLMEPTHQVFWNLTDMFSLYYGDAYHLYTSEQIKGAPSLRSQVDLDHDGVINEPGEPYIDPHPMTYEIGYMAELEPLEPPFTVATVDNLPAGNHIRLIVLVDDELSPNYLRLTWSDSIDSDMDTQDFDFLGVINEELNGIWQTPTQAEDFRHGLSEGFQIPIRQHFHTGVLRCYPAAIDPVTGYTYCPYPEEEAIPADLTPHPVD